MMEQVFFAVVEASVTVSIAAALVMLLAPTAKKRFAAKWRYWVWLVLCVRMLLPVSFSLPQAPITIAAPTQQIVVTRVGQPSSPADDVPKTDASPVVEPGLPVSDEKGLTLSPVPHNSVDNNPSGDRLNPTAQSQPPASYTVTLSGVLAYAWLAGAVIALLLRASIGLWFSHRTKRWNRPVCNVQIETIFEDLKKELGIHVRLPIYENGQIGSPMIIGLLRPCVLLPEISLSAREYEFVLRHELTHYKRHDLWYKLLLMLARCVHWFNPMLSVIALEAENDMEISCDEAVIAGKDIQYRQGYCEAILRLLRFGRQRRLVLSTGFNGNKQVIKRRFEAVLAARTQPGVLPAAVALAVLAACGLLFAYGSTKNPAKPSDTSASQEVLKNREESGEESETEGNYLPLKEEAVDKLPLNEIDTVQAGLLQADIDLTGWTQLYSHSETGADHVLFRVEVYGKPENLDTANLTGIVKTALNIPGSNTAGDIPKNVDRVVVEYTRYLDSSSTESPEKGYYEETTFCLYDESEVGFGGFDSAKLYRGNGDWSIYSFYNPTTGVTLCCTPDYRSAIGINNYGDGPFLHAYKHYPANLDRNGGRYDILMYNEGWRQIDGYGENYCYDVAVYDTQTNTVQVIGEQLPGVYGNYPSFTDENAGLFLLCQTYNNDVHNTGTAMTVYDPANPAQQVAVLDESILPPLPEGATHWCINPQLCLDDSYIDGPYALMFYPYIPGKMPVTQNGDHEKSGVNWYIATLDKNFRVTEVFDTGLAMWGTQEYCSSPADVILRDGLLYFSYYFNADNVFQRERWVYNVVNPAHMRSLMQTTMPDSFYDEP